MGNSIVQKENAASGITLRRMAVAGIMAALTTLMTAYIFHIPVGMNGGYVHLGDAVIYLAAALLPMPYACAVGAIGGGMADLLTAPVWALATMIIKMLICLPFTSKGGKIVTKRNVIACFISFWISAVSYYVAEGLMFGFTAAFFTSIGGSVVQSGGSALVFIILGMSLDRVGFKKKFANGI